MQVTKTPTFWVMYLFPLFVSLREHNPPMLQIDSQKDKHDTLRYTAACRTKNNKHMAIEK